MMGPLGGYGPPPDPEMVKLAEKEGNLEREIADLNGQFHQTPDAEQKEKIKAELRETIAKQFDVRQERRRLELKRLEEQLKHMREVIERRDKAKGQIIDRHLSELLGVEEDLQF
jgi:hypothetical protein